MSAAQWSERLSSPTVAYGTQRLLDAGLGYDQIAGVMGALMQESRLDPSALNEDDGGSPAFGLAQWRGSRLEDLVAYAEESNRDVSSFETQWDFMINELRSSENSTFAKVKEAKTRGEASDIWTIGFERPSRAGRMLAQRKRFADIVGAGFGLDDPARKPSMNLASEEAARAAERARARANGTGPAGSVGTGSGAAGVAGASANAGSSAAAGRGSGGFDGSVGTLGGGIGSTAGPAAAASAEGDDSVGVFGGIGSIAGGLLGGPVGSFGLGAIGRGLDAYAGSNPNSGLASISGAISGVFGDVEAAIGYGGSSAAPGTGGAPGISASAFGGGNNTGVGTLSGGFGDPFGGAAQAAADAAMGSSPSNAFGGVGGPSSGSGFGGGASGFGGGPGSGGPGSGGSSV